MIRDAEIERLLWDYLAPILDAADYPQSGLNLYLVNDDELNAFVAGGTNMFFYTGLLMACDHPDMVQGVMAHELGHITGGHLIKRGEPIKDAMLTQGIAAALGILAAASGATAAAPALMAAGTQLGQAQFSAFSREQEQAADQSAMRYLGESRIPAEGLMDVLTMLRRKERFAPTDIPSYVRTHPLTTERLAHVRHYLMHDKASRRDADDPLVIRHQRMVAKLMGFLAPPQEALNRYLGDPTIAGAYGRSIALFRQGQWQKAIDQLTPWLNVDPNDAYLHELAGQIYFESGQVSQSIPHYEKAARMLENAPLVDIALAAAYLKRNRPDDREKAEQLLIQATIAEPLNMHGWQLRAELYDRIGKPAQSLAARAEVAQLQGNTPMARKLARAAKEGLEPFSPLALRMDDLLFLLDREDGKKPDER